MMGRFKQFTVLLMPDVMEKIEESTGGRYGAKGSSIERLIKRGLAAEGIVPHGYQWEDRPTPGNKKKDFGDSKP